VGTMSLSKMATLLALALGAFGLTGVRSWLPGESNALALTNEECRSLVGGQFSPGPCCDGVTCPKCTQSALCFSWCCSCNMNEGAVKLCKSNGTKCTVGFCDNGIGGCADHACSRLEIC
jgi:hypothetical protein